MAAALRAFGTTGRNVPPVGQGSWRAEESTTGTAIAALMVTQAIPPAIKTCTPPFGAKV